MGSDMDFAYFLTTNRLGFRCWTNDDFDLAVDLWGDRDVTRFIDSRSPPSEDQVRERLSKKISTEREHGIQYWPIFLLKSDEHVGCCGLRPHDKTKRVFEIGFQICKRHWGSGFATEAAAATIAYAFESLSVRTLFAGHHPANHASRHILHNLNFHYTHEEFYEPTGLNHPSYLLAIGDYRKSNAKTV